MTAAIERFAEACLAKGEDSLARQPVAEPSVDTCARLAWTAGLVADLSSVHRERARRLCLEAGSVDLFWAAAKRAGEYRGTPGLSWLLAHGALRQAGDAAPTPWSIYADLVFTELREQLGSHGGSEAPGDVRPARAALCLAGLETPGSDEDPPLEISIGPDDFLRGEEAVVLALERIEGQSGFGLREIRAPAAVHRFAAAALYETLQDRQPVAAARCLRCLVYLGSAVSQQSPQQDAEAVRRALSEAMEALSEWTPGDELETNLAVLWGLAEAAGPYRLFADLGRSWRAT